MNDNDPEVTDSPLSREDLRNWLVSRLPADSAGDIGRSMTCPIAKYLQERNPDWDQIHVSPTGVTYHVQSEPSYPYGEFRLPDWARNFVNRVDRNIDYTDCGWISNEHARQILDLA